MSLKRKLRLGKALEEYSHQITEAKDRALALEKRVEALLEERDGIRRKVAEDRSQSEMLQSRVYMLEEQVKRIEEQLGAAHLSLRNKSEDLARLEEKIRNQAEEHADAMQRLEEKRKREVDNARDAQRQRLAYHFRDEMKRIQNAVVAEVEEYVTDPRQTQAIQRLKERLSAIQDIFTDTTQQNS